MAGTPEYLAKPFRVCHENGAVVQGFDDIESAKVDAADRNQQAKDLGLTCRYDARPKPS